MMIKEEFKKNLNKKYNLILSLFFLVFSQQVNLVIYLTNYQKLGSNPFLVFLAIFLPIIGVGSIIFEFTFKNKLNKIIRSILKDYLPFSIMVFSFLVIFLGQLYEFPRVLGNSMNNTLVNGKRIAIEKYNLNIEHNDIVVAKPDKTKERIVKRVVACPGDVIYFEKDLKNDNFYIRVIRKDTLEYYNFKKYNGNDFNPLFTIKQIGAIKGLINGPISEDSYLEKTNDHNMWLGNASPDLIKKYKLSFLEDKFAFVIPKNKYMLIGDNYTNSRDSRYYGLFDYYKIVGKYIK